MKKIILFLVIFCVSISGAIAQDGILGYVADNNADGAVSEGTTWAQETIWGDPIAIDYSLSVSSATYKPRRGWWLASSGTVTVDVKYTYRGNPGTHSETKSLEEGSNSFTLDVYPEGVRNAAHVPVTIYYDAEPPEVTIIKPADGSLAIRYTKVHMEGTVTDPLIMDRPQMIEGDCEVKEEGDNTCSLCFTNPNSELEGCDTVTVVVPGEKKSNPTQKVGGTIVPEINVPPCSGYGNGDPCPPLREGFPYPCKPEISQCGPNDPSLGPGDSDGDGIPDDDDGDDDDDGIPDRKDPDPKDPKVILPPPVDWVLPPAVDCGEDFFGNVCCWSPWLCGMCQKENSMELCKISDHAKEGCPCTGGDYTETTGCCKQRTSYCEPNADGCVGGNSGNNLQLADSRCNENGNCDFGEDELNCGDCKPGEPPIVIGVGPVGPGPQPQPTATVTYG